MIRMEALPCGIASTIHFLKIIICMPACKFVHRVHAEASRGQKSISDPLKLKLETVTG